MHLYAYMPICTYAYAHPFAGDQYDEPMPMCTHVYTHPFSGDQYDAARPHRIELDVCPDHKRGVPLGLPLAPWC